MIVLSKVIFGNTTFWITVTDNKGVGDAAVSKQTRLQIICIYNANPFHTPL